MKGKLGRSMVALAAGVALSLSTAGAATAATMDGGGGNSGTQAAASKLLQLRDDLYVKAHVPDVNATFAINSDLLKLGTEVSVGQKYATTSQAKQGAVAYGKDATQLQNALADIQKDGKLDGHYMSAEPAPNAQQLPGLPDPLSTLNGLVQSLLAKVSSTVQSLLGGGAAVPSLPSLPGKQQ